MARSYEKLYCSKSDIIRLTRLAQNTTQPRVALRAQMVLLCAEGKQIKEIASRFHERPNTVILWRNRFADQGIEGLLNRPRGKNANQYGTDLRERILGLIATNPPPGHKRWTGSLLSKETGIPPDVIWRCLRKAGIQLTSTDREPTEFTMEIPLQLTVRKETDMSSNKSEKMDLELVARITGKDGTVIEKVVKMKDALPNVKDFDLCTKEGFLQDLDVYEKAYLEARDQLSEGLVGEYLDEASKKNRKQRT